MRRPSVVVTPLTRTYTVPKTSALQPSPSRGEGNSERCITADQNFWPNLMPTMRGVMGVS
jgi:hypothetical protein